MSEYTVLVASHSFVVDTNREVWNQLAKNTSFQVDVLMPKTWTSNLIKNLHYKYNDQTDQHFRESYPSPVYFTGNASFFFFSPLKVYQIFRHKRYDRILLAQETWSLCLLMITIIKYFTPNKKTQIDLWVCQNIKKEKLYWMRYWERLNTVCVNAILHCCEEIKEVIEWKEIKKRCRYFPFSFNPKKYEENYRFNIAEQNSLATIGHLGRLSEEKGIEQLLNCVEKLQSTDKQLHFKIAGGGPLAQEVEKFCEGHDRREFLGLLSHNKAHLFYQNLDLFILTSQTRSFWKEQFGRVIVEAIASGCHFVGSSSGAIPEVMSKLDSPRNYQENDLRELISACELALDDIKSPDYAKLREKRHKLAMETFSHEAVAHLYQNYVQEDMG